MNIYNLQRTTIQRLSANVTAPVVIQEAAILFNWGGFIHYILWDDILDNVNYHYMLTEYVTANEFYMISDEDGVMLKLKDILKPLEDSDYIIANETKVIRLPVSYLTK